MRLIASLLALFLLVPAALAEDTAPAPFDHNYDATEVVDAALDEARAQLLATLLAPATQLVRTLAEPAGQFVRVLAAYRDKQQEAA